MTARLLRPALIPALLAAALLAACAAPDTAQSPETASQRPAIDTPIDVQFVDPSNFAEMRGSRGQRNSKEWMNGLRKHLEQRAPQYLPPGARLQVRFTDVKLVGDYEPWRRPGLNDVRIVRDVYPPRLDLDFRLTNEGGTVREGSAKLRDPSFLMRTQRYPDDPLGHEKLMLDDWLQKEFKAG